MIFVVQPTNQPKENEQMRKERYLKAVPVDKLIPFPANPPERTDTKAKYYQELKARIIADNKVFPPLSLTFDAKLDMYRINTGHTRAAIAKELEVYELPANVTYPEPGEDPVLVNYKMFMRENATRPYAGKAKLYTAIKTRGQVIMGAATKKQYKWVSDYFLKDDIEAAWIEQHPAPDLLKISILTANAISTHFFSRNEKIPGAPDFGFIVRRTAHFLTEKRCQRELRDYVLTHQKNPEKGAIGTVWNAIRKNKDPLFLGMRRFQEKDEGGNE
jgi:hypothetical protein